jgi:hypothetical protein
MGFEISHVRGGSQPEAVSGKRSGIEWKVYSPEGRITAEVEVPRDLTVLGIDDDTVLALFKDELDLEYVRLYHLQR